MRKSRKARKNTATIVLDPRVIAWEEAVYEADPTGGDPARF